MYEEARRVVSDNAFSSVLYTCQALTERQKGEHRNLQGDLSDANSVCSLGLDLCAQLN